MFNQLQKRPQSRSYRSKGAQQLKPITNKTDTNESEKCFQMGKKHHQRNQFSQAQRFYIQATVHNPLHYKAYSNLGLCYKLQCRYNQSIGCYLKALSINPSDEITQYNLGNVYRVIGNYEKSIEHYQKVIKSRNQSQSPLQNLQSPRYLDQQHNQSSPTFTSTPTSLYLDAYNNLGVCYKLTQNYRSAVECFELLLKSKPQDNSVIFNLAVSKLKMVRKMVKDSYQLQSFSLLVKQIILQTKLLFSKVIESDNGNEVAKLGLIELECFGNLTNKHVLQRQLLQLSTIIQSKSSSSSTSSYILDQAKQLHIYCLSLLQKLIKTQQQQEQIRLQVIKKLKQQKLRKQKQASIQAQRVKLDYDKQIFKIRKQEQERVKNQQLQQQQQLQKTFSQQQKNKKTKTIIIQSQQSQRSLHTVQPTKSSTTQFNEQEFQKLWVQVRNELMADRNSQGQSKNTKEQTVTDSIDKAIDECISKYNTMPNTNNNSRTTTQKQQKAASKQIRTQLEILAYTFVGEKLHPSHAKQFFTLAFNNYLNFILSSDIHMPVTRQLVHLSTHRAMASVLTELGYSQKAIQHYQIIGTQIEQVQSTQQKQSINSSNTKDVPIKQQLHSGLAVNYQSQGYYQKAIQQFNKAITINPKNYTLHYNLAYCQHCENKNSQAITNYSKFLQMLQRDSEISQKQKLSYQLQGRISIFLCENQIQKRVTQCERINQMIEEVVAAVGDLRQYVDDDTLLKFYLPACDLLQRLIYSSHSTIQKQKQQSSPQNQQTKRYKQQLFKLYINLLNIHQCPDRGEILINCGNLLFQQREYLNALAFYERAHKYQQQQQQKTSANQKIDIWNMVGIALLHVNEYQRALQCVTYACNHSPNNSVYKLNLQMMKWAFGIQCSLQINKLAQRFTCICDSQFTNRVQLIKSSILKLTNYLQQSVYGNDKESIQTINLQQLFNCIFDTNNNTNWKQPQGKVKHNALLTIMQKHCGQHQNIPIANIISLLTGIIKSPVKSYGQVKSIFSQLKQKLSQNSLTKHPSYLHILSQTLSYFVYYHTFVLKANQPLINRLFTEELYSQLPTTTPTQLTFPNDVIQQHLLLYPSKSFTVIYPKIQLKSQNLIQSLYNWQLKLEDQFVYLIKIIQSIAYKNGVDQSVSVEYNFPYCKCVENCEKCLQKAINVFSGMFEKKGQSRQLINGNQQKQCTLEDRKKALAKGFMSTFPLGIQTFLTKAQQSTDQNILTMSLSQSNLPVSISLHFPTQSIFKVFLTEFCKQLSIPQINYQSCLSQQSMTIIMNKLISFKCEWKSHDFISQFVQNMKVSKLTVKQTAVLWLQQEGISCSEI